MEEYMGKRGFTLSELLIVLAVTGIVAAIILPVIDGLMPDKTKINYLKAYDELGSNIKSLVTDTSLFPILLKEGTTDIDVSQYPLINNTQPLRAPFKDDTKYSGEKKLCNIIAYTFGADSCRNTSYPDKSSFTTSNGIEWWISQTKREIDPDNNTILYQTDIYVDVDSSKKSSNCMYGESNCKNPDRFKFLLAADGRLVPADPVGIHYINTRKNLLKKKFEAEGEVLASLDNIDFNELPSSGGNGTVLPNTTPDNSTGKNTADSEEQLPDEAQNCDTDFALCRCGSTYKGRIINCYTISTHRSTYTYSPSFQERFKYRYNTNSLIIHKIGDYTIEYHQPVDIIFQFPLKRNFYTPGLLYERFDKFVYSLDPFFSPAGENIEYENGESLLEHINDWAMKRFMGADSPMFGIGSYMPVYYVLPAGRTNYRAPDILPEFIQNLTVEDMQSLRQTVDYKEKTLEVLNSTSFYNYEDDMYFNHISSGNVDRDYIYFDKARLSNENTRAGYKIIIDYNIEQSEREKFPFEREELNAINQFIEKNIDKFIEYK